MSILSLVPLDISISRSTVTLLTTAFGFVGGLFSSFGLYWWQNRVRRRTLRQALHTELDIPAEIIKRATEQDADSFSGPLHGEIPTTVYESQADSLGLLSNEELEPLIAYYSTAAVAEEQLQHLDDPDVAERFFEETAPILRTKRKNASTALSDHL